MTAAWQYQNIALGLAGCRNPHGHFGAKVQLFGARRKPVPGCSLHCSVLPPLPRAGGRFWGASTASRPSTGHGIGSQLWDVPQESEPGSWSRGRAGERAGVRVKGKLLAPEHESPQLGGPGSPQNCKTQEPSGAELLAGLHLYLRTRGVVGAVSLFCFPFAAIHCLSHHPWGSSAASSARV